MKFSLGPFSTLNQLLKELITGLKRLTFADNMETFEFSGTIAANTEKKIRNPLTSIPSYVIINGVGNALVTKGNTNWSTDFVYIKNHDASNSSTVKAIFFK